MRGQPDRPAPHQVAQRECERWWIALPDPDLAYLVEGTDEFWHYVRQGCGGQRFALLNREEMMDRVAACFADGPAWTASTSSKQIQCHHNYTAREKHFGKQVWVSRKGAIDASRGHARGDPRLDG